MSHCIYIHTNDKGEMRVGDGKEDKKKWWETSHWKGSPEIKL